MNQICLPYNKLSNQQWPFLFFQKIKINMKKWWIIFKNRFKKYSDSRNMILIHYFMIFKHVDILIATLYINWYEFNKQKQSWCLDIPSLMWLCYCDAKSQWPCISFLVFERNQIESVSDRLRFFWKEAYVWWGILKHIVQRSEIQIVCTSQFCLTLCFLFRIHDLLCAAFLLRNWLKRNGNNAF